MIRRICTTLIIVALSGSFLSAAGRTRSSGHGKSASGTYATAKRSSTPRPASVRRSRSKGGRTAHGKTRRSAVARATFMRQTGYPHGRPGYVVDLIVPLACGGADSPANMQWQAVAAAKAKDKAERIGCR